VVTASPGAISRAIPQRIMVIPVGSIMATVHNTSRIAR